MKVLMFTVIAAITIGVIWVAGLPKIANSQVQTCQWPNHC